jgi:hypothetical protein
LGVALNDIVDLIVKLFFTLNDIILTKCQDIIFDFGGFCLIEILNLGDTRVQSKARDDEGGSWSFEVGFSLLASH